MSENETMVPLSEVLAIFANLCLPCQTFVHKRLRAFRAEQLARAALVPVLAKAAETPHAPRDLEQLLASVADRSGVLVEDVVGACRERHLVAARVAFAVAAREEGYSFPQIGRALRRHHTSIMHYFEKSGGRAA